MFRDWTVRNVAPNMKNRPDIRPLPGSFPLRQAIV